MRKKEEWLETSTVQARGLRVVTVKKENIAQGLTEAVYRNRLMVIGAFGAFGEQRRRTAPFKPLPGDEPEGYVG